MCSRSSDNVSIAALPCTMKFVVTVALDGGENNTEEVLYWQSATDAVTSQQVELASPVVITFAKSSPMIVYPLTYVRNFNAQPFETTVYTSLLQGCYAGTSPSAPPTCGWAYSSSGQPIPFSDGFCCDCSACQLLGICSSTERGNTRCAVLGSAAAAACLNFGPLWYSGYSIGPAQTWFTITVTIAQQGMPDVVLTVGPNNLAAVSATFGVSVELIGDFAAFQQPPDYESDMLFVPSLPLDSPVVQAGVSEWMIIPDTMVSIDGTQCNMIGVSYEGFVTQGSRCNVPSGTCLANQLSDLRAADAARVAGGETPLYLATAMGNVELTYGSTSATANTPFLAFVQDAVQASEIVITFVADNMSFSVNTASGKILSVSVSNFSALSSSGVITVTILNTGSLTADFYVSVLQCTSGTLNVAAQTVSLQPLQVSVLSFQLDSVLFQGSNYNTCNVTLMNSLYDIVASQLVTFTVAGINVTDGAQGGSGTEVGGLANPPISASPAAATSCTSCPFYNPVCFVTRACFWQVIVQVLVALVTLFVIGLLIKNRHVVVGLCTESAEAKAERRHREQMEMIRLEQQQRRHQLEMQRETVALRRVRSSPSRGSPYGHDDENRTATDPIQPSPRRRVQHTILMSNVGRSVVGDATVVRSPYTISFDRAAEVMWESPRDRSASLCLTPPTLT